MCCVFYLVRTSLNELIKKNKIDKNRLKIVHAGPHAELFKKVLNKYDLEDIFDDHGYVSREEALKLQLDSDLFLLLSWNTKAEQGVLTGKFYEGIRANKPILSSVFGDVPYSELYRLNEKYNYGFCYECCRHNDQFERLYDYLLDLYTQKQKNGFIDYKPSHSLALDFCYENITKKLENLCYKLLEQKK